LKTLLKLFHLFSIQKLVTMDTHTPESLKHVVPFDFIEVSASVELTRKILDGPLAGSDSLLVAPDKGGIERVEATAKEVGLDCVHIEKRRDRDTGEVTGVLPFELDERYSGALVLDDIICTGGTMVLASQLLREAGVKDLVAGATHLVLLQDAGRRLLSSGYRDVVGTDSIETVFSWIGCEVFLAKALRGE
ncbi:MAG: phosphoribosyltransferase family protein, partial [Candidatus Geothermarchaeales archaeon]